MRSSVKRLKVEKVHGLVEEVKGERRQLLVARRHHVVSQYTPSVVEMKLRVFLLAAGLVAS
jgi:hypothetical protein